MMINYSSKLSLPLFKTRIFFVNNVQFSFTAYNFTICATLLYRCSNLHDRLIKWFYL